MTTQNDIPMIQVGNTLISAECITEKFCCDISACKGVCCVEGEAGAPVTLEEIDKIKNILPIVKDELSRVACKTIKRQGVAYVDTEGELVTSIVNGQDCVFTYHDAKGCCLCALERAYIAGKTNFVKPISCALYPIRITRLNNGMQALNYHRWNVCAAAQTLGKKLNIAVYEFLRKPLICAFGKTWYEELTQIVAELKRQHYISA